MKKIVFVLLGTMILATSCVSIVVNSVRGEGEVVVENITFDPSSVQALGVSSGFDVVLDSSVEPGVVEITTCKNIMEYVEVEVSNGSLEIGMRRGNSYDVERLEARLSPVGLSTFAVSGGVDMICSEPLNIEGTMVMAVSGGADVDFAEVVAAKAVVAVSGGADVELRGGCRELEVAVSGGADVDLGEFCAESVKAEASGGADLDIYATVSYVIDASGAADVEYRNSGATTDIESSGAAEVTSMN